MCVGVRAPKHSGKFKTQWSRSEGKHGSGTPLLPFMLSELSVRLLGRMSGNDTLFVSAKKD